MAGRRGRAADPRSSRAIRRLLHARSRWSMTSAAARALVATAPELTAVTRDGDVLGAYFAAGGSQRPAEPDRGPGRRSTTPSSGWPRPTTPASGCGSPRPSSTSGIARPPRGGRGRRWPGCTSPTPRWRRVAEELGQLSATARSAHGEADRLRQAIAAGRGGPGPRPRRAGRSRAAAGARPGEHRRRAEPDPAERDRLAEEARLARAAEMDARLALRTDGGAGPGAGRAGRCAAPGGRGRAAGPGQGAGPAGADAAARRKVAAAVHAGAAGSWPRQVETVDRAGRRPSGPTAEAARTEAEAALGASPRQRTRR